MIRHCEAMGNVSRVFQGTSDFDISETGAIQLEYLKESGKIELFKGKKLLYSAGDGFLNGIGDLLLLISIAKLDASVQYPLGTGGVMVFSTLISITRREKIRTTEYIAAALALVASVLMAF